MRKLYALLIALCAVTVANAQAPTSLQYPPTNVFVTQLSNVYLAPTVAGNVTSYSISPDVTTNTGLAFNTSTGVISGIPTTASANTTYTITATNASGSTSTTLSILVFNYSYNNANGQVSFLQASRTFVVGTNGQSVGDVALYSNVTTIGGVQIDCLIRTAAVTAGTTWSSYDQPAVTGTGWSSNSDNFFSPQFTFPSGTDSGSVRFDFQFILGGSYVSQANPGTNVILQNVQLNTYDIDGNGGANSNQYNEFGGFATYELSNTGSPNTYLAPSYTATNGLTRFRSNTDANITDVSDVRTRARVSYANMSNFSIIVGGRGLAYFFLDFSPGGAFSTVSTSAPSIDLNTTLAGVNNNNAGCSTALPFTGATPPATPPATVGTSQTNSASGTALNEFTLRFPTVSIVNGANERLVINGASAGSPIALNFANAAAIPNVTIGGVTYTVTATVAGGVSLLSFVNGVTTFTQAELEALLDAMQYQNIASSPTVTPSRNFTVNVRNMIAKSPDAIFTAQLNCVTLSGNVFHDANALTDNTVNASGTVTGFGVPMYAILTYNGGVNNNQTVVPSVLIPAGTSAYSFGNVSPGKYNIYFSTLAVPTVGTNISNSTYPVITGPYPATYYSTGENLGAAAGNDGGTPDGKLIVTVGSLSATNANFGLQVPPNATATDQTPSFNPGGFNYRDITGTNFGTADADGTVSFIRITAFPTFTNALRVGSTVYTNGGTCPPQSTCTNWPGTLDVAYDNTNGYPVPTISVDPTPTGATTVSISYRALDNGGALSANTVTVNVPFSSNPAITISGNVWNDANGNGINSGAPGEPYTAAGNPNLYALLVQTSNTYSGAPTVYASALVTAAATGYTFSNVPSGNDYSVRIVALTSAPADGAALSNVTLALASGYTAVSTNNNGTIATGLNATTPGNPSIALGTVTTDRPAVNFGIEQIPVADAKAFAAPASSFAYDPAVTIGGQTSFWINANSGSLTGSPIKSLSGSDAEDCSAASSCIGNGTRSYRIQTINTNTRLFYNGTEVLAGNTIPTFDVNNLRVYGARGQGFTAPTALGFTYSLVDAAGVPSPPVTYSLQSTGTPLPVTLVSFDAEKSGSGVQVRWTVANENRLAAYLVQRSADGASWTQTGRVTATGADGYSFSDAAPLAGDNYYRLEMVEMDGSSAYSSLRKVVFGKAGGITVLPNPVTDHLTVRADGKKGTATLLNAVGAVVLRAELNGTARIDMRNLPAGTYLVQVVTDGAPAAFRVTKQ